MNAHPELSPAAEASIRNILEWLAAAHDRSGSDDAEQLYGQLLKLRAAPVPIAHRIKLLDLLYSHVERVVKAELPYFQKLSLPVGRTMRLRVMRVIDLLEPLAQDYFHSLSEPADPAGGNSPLSPHNALSRAMQSIAWQIKINHLVAAPTGVGLWQQLHAAYRSARYLGLESLPDPRGGPCIRRAYADALLAAIAQPASFTTSELDFVHDYIEGSPLSVELSEIPPVGGGAVFWIDLDRDYPAHALIRRLPPVGSLPLYFSCDAISAEARRQLGELEEGVSAADLGLPAFAETRAGHGVLRRLGHLWGEPAKRRFPRRHQTYRANLCLGLDNLWRLMRRTGDPVPLSEWMVTNESPEGYALMHVSGATDDLRIGDVVALQAMDETPPEGEAAWRICIVRWAISENPEHVELGLQLIAPYAIAGEIAQPYEMDAGRVAALILPETPPLHPCESLMMAPGKIRNLNAPLILLVETDHLLVREIYTGNLDELTSSVELFSFLPSDSI